jgi:hypothetical protein
VSAGKVGVLAVMRRVSAVVLQGEARNEMRRDMDEARAAVAELIAASQKALHHPSTDYNVRVDLRAALAGVQP